MLEIEVEAETSPWFQKPEGQGEAGAGEGG